MADLPARPNLTQLRHQAKDLLHAAQRGDQAALARIQAVSDRDILASAQPRARVLLPIWELRDDLPVGWIAAYKTPVKVAHLARNPHTTISYWSPRQNAVFADCTGKWVEDIETRRDIWDLYKKGSPTGVGYDPANFWHGGPADPKFGLLRLDPWRVQVLRGVDLSSRFWQAS